MSTIEPQTGYINLLVSGNCAVPCPDLGIRHKSSTKNSLGCTAWLNLQHQHGTYYHCSVFGPVAKLDKGNVHDEIPDVARLCRRTTLDKYSFLQRYVKITL